LKETFDGGKKEMTIGEESASSSAPVEYTFDMISQYFERNKTIQKGLDLSDNSWGALSGHQSETTLADDIAHCRDALQTAQEIMLKSFAATAVVVS
uniref:Rubis-subs-bind domain-containing protein n=1 Tax=Gongylonema pulchrum TaxID=637853 RepID=A0A183EZU5_9BILA